MGNVMVSAEQIAEDCDSLCDDRSCSRSNLPKEESFGSEAYGPVGVW